MQAYIVLEPTVAFWVQLGQLLSKRVHISAPMLVLACVSYVQGYMAENVLCTMSICLYFSVRVRSVFVVCTV